MDIGRVGSAGGSRRRRGILQTRISRCAVLVRVRRVPEPGGQGQDRGSARRGPDRRQTVRGVPAASRAVNGSDRGSPPRSQILQYIAIRYQNRKGYNRDSVQKDLV